MPFPARSSGLLVCLVLLASCNADSTSGSSDLGATLPDLASRPGASDLSSLVDLAPSADLVVEPDLSTLPDLAQENPCAMHDLANASCDDLARWVGDWLACHQACSDDKDCQLVSAHDRAFCRNPCDRVAAGNATGTYLDALNDAFVARNCGMNGCACLNPGSPSCVMGTCQGI